MFISFVFGWTNNLIWVSGKVLIMFKLPQAIVWVLLHNFTQRCCIKGKSTKSKDLLPEKHFKAKQMLQSAGSWHLHLISIGQDIFIFLFNKKCRCICRFIVKNNVPKMIPSSYSALSISWLKASIYWTMIECAHHAYKLWTQDIQEGSTFFNTNLLFIYGMK